MCLLNEEELISSLQSSETLKRLETSSLEAQDPIVELLFFFLFESK